MRRQKRISRYLPSVCRSGDRVNPLGEYRLRGSRIATIIASSSMERTVDLASLGPVGRSATVSRCFHFATVFRELAMKKGAWANIPPKSNRGEPICFGRARNRVDRFFNKIKQ